MATKKQKEEEKKQQQEAWDTEATSSSNTTEHERGLVLVANKIFEPLDTLLMAYETQSNSWESLEKQWESYPDLELEKCRFSMCKWLVEVTQALIEQHQN